MAAAIDALERLCVPSDLVIRGAAGVDGDVAVEGGRIAGVGDRLAGREEVDAARPAPAPRRHRRARPLQRAGRAHWEGWATGSRALLAGGGTTCVEMPLNAHPPTLDGAAFDAKVEAATASSVVDFALWGGLTPLNLDRLEELAERGVVGFKAFMCDSGIDDFPAADDDTLHAGMAQAAALAFPWRSTPSARRGCARRKAATGARGSRRARSTRSSRRSRPRSCSPATPAATSTSST